MPQNAYGLFRIILMGLLLKKTVLFRKLAIKSQARENYDQFIREIDTKNIYDIVNFIAKNHFELFFEPDDFVEPLFKIAMARLDPELVVVDLKESRVPDKIIAKIFDPIVMKILNGSEMYLDFFVKFWNKREYLTKQTIKKLREKLVLRWIRLYREEKLIRLEREWNLIAYSSTIFPMSFFDELAKKFGVNFHTRVNSKQSLINKQKLDTVIPQKTYSIYDLDRIFNNPSIVLSKRDIQMILERSDNQAKEYMKALVYYPRFQIDKAFILMDDMTPIDTEYNDVEWPAEIKATKLKYILGMPEHEEIGKKLQQLFLDFKRISA